MPVENEEQTSESLPNSEQLATGSTESQTSTSSQTDDGVFDAAAIEDAFGLPAGTLEGVTDQKAALDKVRDYTDQSLLAGLTVAQQAAATKVVTPVATDTTTKVVTPPAGGGNAEVDALRAKLEAVETKLNEREKAETNKQLEELNNRAAAEVDSWASAKYGVSGSRNFRQTKAHNDLIELVVTHSRGFGAGGKQPPVIEKLLRQVRAFDDETYVPPKSKANPDSLGSPGARKDAGDNKGPANIHQALIQSGR